MSESQERMMAVVEPQHVESSSRSRQVGRRGDVIGEVTDSGRLQIDWHGEHGRRRPAALGGPRRARRTTAVRAPAMAGRPAGDGAEALPRPATGEELRATLLRLAQPEPLRQVVDHRPVRPLRPGQHRARPAQRQRDDPGRRGDRPRRRGRDRLQRPVRQARPVRRRAAGARRGLPQRRDRRRVAAGGHRLPQLRLARGPGRDVAVRRGLPGPQGRLPRARHPRHRRQRSPLQPDRRDRDPADTGGRRARRHRGRHAPDPVRVRRRRRAGVPARRDPGELSGSEWAHVVHGHLGGRPPSRRPRHGAAARRRARRGRREGLDAAHDLSDGGLAQALCRVGAPARCRREVPSRLDEDPFVALFSESAGRVLVSVVPGNEDELRPWSRRRACP